MINVSDPSIARVYDHWLGGRNTYLPDRAIAEQITKRASDVPAIAVGARHFINRAASYIAARGVDHFLDIGAGLPLAPTIADTVGLTRDQPRIINIDNDRLVVSHARAQLANGDTSIVLHGDLNSLHTILGHIVVKEMLDNGRPIGLLLGSVLHYVRDAATAVDELKRALPAGSYMAISHATPHDDHKEAARIYSEHISRLYLRTPFEVEAFFDRLDLVGPGVVPVNAWQASASDSPSPVVGGVARKPGRL